MTERILGESESAFLRTLRRGQIVQGTVIEIAHFGVTFVDIGGFTAMINIPEISWRYIDHPSDVVAVGQEVTAEILDVDFGRGRVSLSLKALQDDPFQELQQRVGHVVTGPVTKVVPFGVFVRVENVKHGFEGLLPRSELGQSTVEVGDLLTVRIAQVDVTRRRIALTLPSMGGLGEDRKDQP
ncbi:S1 RNA-binding domain-containing protein [Actinocorallia sp. B10E7]|uniref:S1 RNA-binding domain-containing protein n=1 Tax=Actinocorallia sp. B10E7 TaxID=3153558 RepID=UPI00325D554B